MADYRDVSQQYAQGAIKAAFVLNGGAAVAMLTQLTSLIEIGAASAAYWPVTMWAVGTALAAGSWVPAFFSTRYVDKYEKEGEELLLDASNNWMKLAVLAVSMSLMIFVAGAFVMARLLP